MQSGAFQDVEDVLIQALKSSPSPEKESSSESSRAQGRTGAQLIAAMQASPFKDLSLDSTGERSTVSDVAF